LQSITYFYAKNKCVVCCVVCENKECESWGQAKECERCDNFQCVNNGHICDYDCENCKNIHCVNNARFDPIEEFFKHC
jgi:hypothetical protein